MLRIPFEISGGPSRRKNASFGAMKKTQGFVYSAANKLGNYGVLAKQSLRIHPIHVNKKLETTVKRDYRRSTQVVRAVASKESIHQLRKQLADSLNEEALRLLGYLHGHRSLFVAGVGFDTVAATLFRKLDTASAYPTVRRKQEKLLLY